MPTISTSTFTATSANIMTIEVGTNCPQGGDAGHGGRTFLRIHNDSCTNLRVRVNDGKLVDADSVELVLGGDTECETFIQVLEYAVATLKENFAMNNGINRTRQID